MRYVAQYSTRLYGAPYGINGERGDETLRPSKTAARTLHPGQTMDVFDAINDPEQQRPIQRFKCGPDGVTDEVVL